MELTGLVWEGGDDGHLTKVEVTVERTDADEIALIGNSEDSDGASLYLSVDMAQRVAAMLLIASYAHEIQAHEAARIASS